jgi:hypothetical protein
MLTQIEKGRCPLCQEVFPLTDLFSHAERESKEIEQYTIEMIKSQHPEWVKEDAACPKCWEYYNNL